MIIGLSIAALLSVGLSGLHIFDSRKLRGMSDGNTLTDGASKQMLRGLLYCQSVIYLTSAAVLFICALKLISGMYAFSLLLFIGLNFGIFAIWNLYVAMLSNPESTKRFYLQAVVLFSVSCLSLFGALAA
ncbi:hypothetical protein L9G16_17865 [Shewanella sp. A25]|nr:hypothetical protein [Shewanella shenzhenensis]